MNARIDVTELVEHSKRTGSKFYINFLYLLSKVLNSRDDYKMGYLWQSEELICYDSINPIQYVFHEDTETCTPVYMTYYEDYEVFYRNAMNDVERAKKTREYGLGSTRTRTESKTESVISIIRICGGDFIEQYFF